MKYPASLLMYPLSQLYPGEWIHPSYVMKVERPVFYESGKDYTGQCLIVQPDVFDECVGHAKDCMLIVNGRADLSGTRGPAYFIEEPRPVTRLFNDLGSICSRLDRWTEEMQQTVFSYGVYDDLWRCSDEIITRGYSLFDTDFRFIALSEKIISDHDLLTYIVDVNKDGERIIPINNLIDYTKSKVFAGYAGSSAVFRIEEPQPSFNRNIFFNGRRVGLISLATSGDPLEDSFNCAAIDLLSVYVTRLYSLHHGFYAVHSDHTRKESLLQAYLRGERPSLPKEWQDLSGSDYALFLIEEDDPPADHDRHSVYLFNHLESRLPGTFCFAAYGQIAVLSVCSATPGDIREILGGLLEEMKMKAGISRRFDSLDMLPAAYRQAGYALRYANGDGGRRAVVFDAVAFDYLLEYGLQQSSVVPLSTVVSPAVQILKDYDKTHKADLTATLYAYLKNNCNATETARELGIHRSSFLTRLERIIRSTGIDPADHDTRLYLELSFAMLEMADRYQEGYPGSIRI